MFHISSCALKMPVLNVPLTYLELLYKSQNILDNGTKAGSLLLRVAYPIFLPPTLGPFQHK